MEFVCCIKNCNKKAKGKDAVGWGHLPFNDEDYFLCRDHLKFYTLKCDNDMLTNKDIQPERSKREDVFVIKGSNECIAIDAIPSKECKEYHENSYIQINGQLRRCGALNSMET